MHRSVPLCTLQFAVDFLSYKFFFLGGGGGWGVGGGGREGAELAGENKMGEGWRGRIRGPTVILLFL